MTEGTFPEPSRGEQITTLGRLSVRSWRDGDVHAISLEGEMDLSNAGDVESELLDVEATDARTIVLDLSGLTFMDSTGIRLLVSAGARSRSDGGRLVIERPSPAVMRLLRISGVHELLGFGD